MIIKTKQCHSFACLVMLLLLSGSVETSSADNVVGLPADSLENVLQPVLDDLTRSQVLGLNLAVALPDSHPVQVSSGYVDAERSQAMETSRLFQIGSQTKMFTAAAILLLERDGKLSLDDQVAKYVPGVTGSPELNIEQLLTHTGGIGDSITLFDPPARNPDFNISLEDHLLLGRVMGEQFEAGERWQYNNLGFIILGRIVELVSGQTLDAFVRSRLLQPLGMNSTWLGALESYPEAMMARGYFRDSHSGERIDVTVPDLSWASSAGDMVSNLADLLTWANALQDGGNAVGLTLRDFQRSVVATGSTGAMRHYGLGMMARNLNGRELWGHGGNIHGYLSLTLIDQESGIVIALLANLEDFSDGLIPTLEAVASMAFHLGLLALQVESEDT